MTKPERNSPEKLAIDLFKLSLEQRQRFEKMGYGAKLSQPIDWLQASIAPSPEIKAAMLAYCQAGAYYDGTLKKVDGVALSTVRDIPITEAEQILANHPGAALLESIAVLESMGEKVVWFGVIAGTRTPDELAGDREMDGDEADEMLEATNQFINENRAQFPPKVMLSDGNFVDASYWPDGISQGTLYHAVGDATLGAELATYDLSLYAWLLSPRNTPMDKKIAETEKMAVEEGDFLADDEKSAPATAVKALLFSENDNRPWAKAAVTAAFNALRDCKEIGLFDGVPDMRDTAGYFDRREEATDEEMDKMISVPLAEDKHLAVEAAVNKAVAPWMEELSAMAKERQSQYLSRIRGHMDQGENPEI